MRGAVHDYNFAYNAYILPLFADNNTLDIGHGPKYASKTFKMAGTFKIDHAKNTDFFTIDVLA